MVHVNLSDVSNDFEVLPEGVYDAVLVEAELIERDDPTKSPYIKWEYKLTDKAGKAWNNTSLKDTALWKLRETLEAFGEDPDLLDGDEGFDLDPTDYIGSEVRLHITIGTYRGKETNQVESVLPPGEGEDEPAPKAKASTAPAASSKKRSRRKVV